MCCVEVSHYPSSLLSSGGVGGQRNNEDSRKGGDGGFRSVFEGGGTLLKRSDRSQNVALLSELFGILKFET